MQQHIEEQYAADLREVATAFGFSDQDEPAAIASGLWSVIAMTAGRLTDRFTGKPDETRAFVREVVAYMAEYLREIEEEA